MRTFCLVALAAAAGLACASDTPGGTPAETVWVRPEHPDWRDSKFRGDRLQCRTEAGSVHVERTRGVFEECMADRGYTLVDDGKVSGCTVAATGTFWGWPEAFCKLRPDEP